MSPLEHIRAELRQKSKGPASTPHDLTVQERRLLEKIRRKTEESNSNNITRTKAYLDFYLRYPDIHWAFLGHMVSRNGGWNMTDLQGEFLPRLLSEKERKSFYHFLERGNWLIFQDAFPQFLIYEESLQQQKPLFHLFPFLNVSTFMETVWNHYWKQPDHYLLCMALIINEQHYLEQRVIRQPLYQKEVLHQFKFFLQDLLSFNHILFPYENGKLAGQTMHQFESLHERILLGKRLYSVLFANKDFLRQVIDWAKRHPHTGSRKDYWPHLFNDVKEGGPGITYPLRLKSCRLRKGAKRLYSPRLEYAWKNVVQQEAEKGDWFTNEDVANYLVDDTKNIDREIKHEYCKTLERLEIAAVAKKTINFLG
ncbi:DUF2515 domain-containing protein [Bacillus rubiinfantis]|uniref:DUF2515 domain-containing protein n=1 Tax=Bacillus rubiinfantis TaxID=1499680 RepID=UPI0005A6D444|nr:DUF2515 domain-containing protein [Bacillus rubiinfantis]